MATCAQGYGGPAYNSRAIAVGDVVTEVEGRSVIGLQPEDVARLLKGPAGSAVLLVVRCTGACEEPVLLERQGVSQLLARGSGGRVLVSLSAVLNKEVRPVAASGAVRVRIEEILELPDSGAKKPRAALQYPQGEARALHDRPCPACSSWGFTAGLMYTHSRAVDPGELSSRGQTAQDAGEQASAEGKACRYFCVVRLRSPSLAASDKVQRSAVVAGHSSQSEGLGTWARLGASLAFDLAGADETSVLQVGVEVYRQGGMEGGDSVPDLVGHVAAPLRAMLNPYPVELALCEPGGVPVVSSSGAPTLLRLRAQLEGEAAPVLPQEPIGDMVGVVLTMSGVFETIVDKPQGRVYAHELRCDVAAALYASDERFEVCGLQKGSIIVYINILPDSTRHDARTPAALARLLESQVKDRSAPLHIARTTRLCKAIEHEPRGFASPASDASLVVSGKPSLPAAGSQGGGQPAERQRNAEGGVGLGASGKDWVSIAVLGDETARSVRHLSREARESAALSHLADGQVPSPPALIHFV